MNTATQRQKILKYCAIHGSITIREAFTKLNINSPSKRISELRNSAKYKVESIEESRTGKNGRITRYKRYYINELQTEKGN